MNVFPFRCGRYAKALFTHLPYSYCSHSSYLKEATRWNFLIFPPFDFFIGGNYSQQDKEHIITSGGSRIFPRGGAPTPKSSIIFQFFAENCMKMKEFGPPGGARVPGAPPWIRQWLLHRNIRAYFASSTTKLYIPIFSESPSRELDGRSGCS